MQEFVRGSPMLVIGRYSNFFADNDIGRTSIRSTLTTHFGAIGVDDLDGVRGS